LATYHQIFRKFPSLKQSYGNRLEICTVVAFRQTIFVSKASFNLKPREPVSEIPPAILKRCFGKQAPVVPHSQRLLAAATKEAKGPGNGKAEGTDKGKTAKKAKTKQTKPREKKTSKPKTKTEKKAAEPKRKTPYAEAKDLFINKFQVRIS